MFPSAVLSCFSGLHEKLDVYIYFSCLHVGMEKNEYRLPDMRRPYACCTFALLLSDVIMSQLLRKLIR